MVWDSTEQCSIRIFSSAAEAMKTTGSIMLTAALLLSDGAFAAYRLRGTGIDEDLSMDNVSRFATAQVRYLRRSVDPSSPDPSSMSKDHAKVNNTNSGKAAGPISTTNFPDLELSSLGASPTHVEVGISSHSHSFGSSNLVEFVVRPSERISFAALPFSEGNEVPPEIESRVLPVTDANQARHTARNFWFGSHHPSRYHMKPHLVFGVMNRQKDRLPVHLPRDLPRIRERQHRHYFADVSSEVSA